MGWLKTLFGAAKGAASARWFLPVMIGAAALVTIVFGYGYMKGYNSAEEKYLVEINRAMKAQFDQLKAVHEKDLRAVLGEASRSQDVRQRIAEIRSLFTECRLPAECVRAFNDGVRATGTSPQGADD